ncbi:MAG: hypothetical protein HYZ53_29050 [Planctomycetes bacterium]|nr:hypothetical protein [Planctomycetota bacterium]
MGRGKRKRKGDGHYCWSCDSTLANERFSGRGHARHLCRDCEKLDAAELEGRQALRNLERAVTWEGFIYRRQRAYVRRLLSHPDARVRAAAAEVVRVDAEERLRMRGERTWAEGEAERFGPAASESPDGPPPSSPDAPFEEREIPF